MRKARGQSDAPQGSHTRLMMWIGAAFLALLIAPGSALANHVQCGDVITQDTTLDSDVVCTGGAEDPLTGVVIGASGITVDLNGFRSRDRTGARTQSKPA